jgi:hypothetical protein
MKLRAFVRKAGEWDRVPLENSMLRHLPLLKGGYEL